ncbi:MAG: hypothetical protein K6346_07265 [Halothiobacillaceae bacterium]
MPASLMTLRPLDEDRCAWVLETDDGIQSGEAGWAALPHPPLYARIRILIPGDRITHATVTLATRNPKLIQQALPYALEEQLADDIEALHIAHGPRDGKGRVAARIMRREDLDRLQERLHQHDLKPDAIYSELDALPIPAEGWVTLAFAGLWLARNSQGEAFALEPELLTALRDDAEPVRMIETPEGPLVWLHSHLNERDGINLIDHDRATGLMDQLRPWRAPALLVAIALLLQGGLMLHEIHTLHQQRAAMQAEIERMAREAAPQVKRWVNPIAQLRQLATGGTAPPAESGMLDMLARLAPALAARPGIKLGALRFQGGTLEAQLRAADAGSLESLLEMLRKQQGASVELAEQRVEGGQATGRLRMKGKTS